MTRRDVDPNSSAHADSAVEPDDGLFLEIFLDGPDDEEEEEEVEIDWVAQRERRQRLNLSSRDDSDLWILMPDEQ